MSYVLSVKAEQCVAVCLVQTEVTDHKIIINQNNKMPGSESPTARIVWLLEHST